ncbi:protein SAR DEFICIENT 1-like [Macadamia integrifolia]|uniref:protein SAR DEFICIENT 1-like n=1 Tax=Macadamia integrifolia TaxID=60698 RepID=UPI001C4E3A91|nr:protein SAR DEFICIENT 1-like [Macadamia integrifolia]
MAAKRLIDDQSRREPNDQDPKKRRTTPSFAAVIGEVVMVQYFQKFVSSLEPLLRRVVNEEVERGLRRCARLSREPSLQIRAAAEASTLTLSFSKKLSLPVFTGSKIEDVENSPLQILLMDTNGDRSIPTALPCPIKVEIVAIDGDFPLGDSDNWTSEQFNSKIVREREGKRPLLTGDHVVVTVRDGFAMISDLSFTDNSSWIRSRKFRLGARVVPGSCQGVKIHEAMTEPFMVKDHRGELYKKHHPPYLEDEVWRLEKIGKDGAFHRKLASEGIHKVQDLLKLWVVDSTKLRKILGGGMSDKTWEATIKHAKTCVMGTKLYKFDGQGLHYSIVLNPICQVAWIIVDGQFYNTHDLTGAQRAHVQKLIREAYMKWDSLEEFDGMVNENIAPQPLGDMEVQCLNHHQNIARLNHHNTFITDTFLVEVPNGIMEYEGDQPQNLTYFNPQVGNTNVYNIPEYSSERDSTPPRIYFS